MRSCLNCKFSYRAYVNGKIRCTQHKGHRAYLSSENCEDWEYEFADVLQRQKEGKKNESNN